MNRQLRNDIRNSTAVTVGAFVGIAFFLSLGVTAMLGRWSWMM